MLRIALLCLCLPALACTTARRSPPPPPPEVEEDVEDLRLEEGPPPDRDRATALVEEGRKLRDEGDHVGALSRFQAARDEDESLGLAHLEWAVTAQYVGVAPAEVRDGFARATLLLEENPRAYYERAAFEESNGDLGAALEGYRRALALRPDHALARIAFARALATTGDHAGARAQYAHIVETDAKSLVGLLGLADAAEKTGDLNAAEDALQRVVGLHPSVAAHRRRLIAFYERTGQAKKALREGKRLDHVDPDNKRRMRTLKPSRRKR